MINFLSASAVAGVIIAIANDINWAAFGSDFYSPSPLERGAGGMLRKTYASGRPFQIFFQGDYLYQ